MDYLIFSIIIFSMVNVLMSQGGYLFLSRKGRSGLALDDTEVQLHDPVHHAGELIHDHSRSSYNVKQTNSEDTRHGINTDFLYSDMENVAKDAMKVHTRTKKQAECIEGLCENVEDYPHEKIKRLLKNVNIYDEYFRELEINILESRYNLNANEETICRTKKHTIYPEKANNTKNKERTIVNSGDYKQGIQFDICADTECRFSEAFPVASHCQQKYITKRLMVLSEEKESFAFDNFEVPSCCVCVYKTL